MLSINTFHIFVDLLCFFCDVLPYIKLESSSHYFQGNVDGDDHVIIHVGGNLRARPSLRDVSDKVMLNNALFENTRLGALS